MDLNDEDMIRFHNGDTLDNIPVVRDEEPRRINWRAVSALLGLSASIGMVIGLSFGIGDRPHHRHTVAAATDTPIPKATRTPVPSPVVTVTQQATVTATPQTNTAPDLEQVYVIQAPATGGDPSTNYCFAYTELGATLLANAPAYQCDDYLFSAHPDDMQGVFETHPVDCSATPDARSAEVTFAPSTYWGAGRTYTCLLLNDGA